ncbi:helix-turn-helix transcriptional regulator [Mycobacterium antarcticum]|nr:helix-turn-helix transcriptional regulator [Mycolicibacterium sp. TUM20985]
MRPSPPNAHGRLHGDAIGGEVDLVADFGLYVLADHDQRVQLRDGPNHIVVQRGWTQTELAKMITDQGVGIGMHWTTIAKIEKGDRSVKIDEAVVIADLFEVSVDSLLGRQGKDDRGLYPLRLLKDSARQAEGQVTAVAAALAERMDDAKELDFRGRDSLLGDGEQVAKTLHHASLALGRIAGFDLPAEATIRPPEEEETWTTITGVSTDTKQFVDKITRAANKEFIATLDEGEQ